MAELSQAIYRTAGRGSWKGASNGQRGDKCGSIIRKLCPEVFRHMKIANSLSLNQHGFNFSANQMMSSQLSKARTGLPDL